MTDYIEIAGRRLRVECNWNAVIAFLEARGTDSLEALQDLSKLKASDYAPLMAACINEGERLDGRESSLTALDLGTMPGFIAALPEFIRIYVKQSVPQAGPQEDAGKKA